MSPRPDEAVLSAIATFDTPTVFNAVCTLLGGGVSGEGLEQRGGIPINYTDGSMRSLLPEFGMAVGYATTCEVFTNTRDFAHVPWDDYYDYLDATPGPTISVFKDVGAKPGRGASLGDGMAAMHQFLGSKGLVVDGTVRDLNGIRDVGIPVWAHGQVSGHGVFYATRFDGPFTVCDLAISPGDLLAADADGVVSIPDEIDLGELVTELETIAAREAEMKTHFDEPGATLASIRQRRRAK